MQRVRQFTFPEGTDAATIRAAMDSAIFFTESWFGKPRLRIWDGYSLAGDGSSCSIDVSSDVGEHVGVMFAAIIMETLGEEEFSVQDIEGLQHPQPKA